MKTKVLVVDDSIFMQKLITRLIDLDDSLQVVGSANNGLEAISLVGKLKPDVVTLDVEMPVMNGLDALKRIMEQYPTPIIMLSSLTQDGAAETIEALHLGAIDFITKPSGSISADLYKVREELINKIKLAAQVRLPGMSRTFPKVVFNDGLKATKEVNQTGFEFDQIVAIGTSTGGPKALDIVISALPANISFPVLVVQHMPPKFTRSLADRLNRSSQVKVVEATNNERLVGGTVYIAPGDYHMTVKQQANEFRIVLHQQDPRNGHRPSVDIMFESVTRLTKLRRHYVIMTGMGSDGARGMLEAKQQGAHSTIAEAKETCIVYGMPRSAIENSCVDYVEPLHHITARIIEVTHMNRTTRL